METSPLVFALVVVLLVIIGLIFLVTVVMIAISIGIIILVVCLFIIDLFTGAKKISQNFKKYEDGFVLLAIMVIVTPVIFGMIILMVGESLAFFLQIALVVGLIYAFVFVSLLIMPEAMFAMNGSKVIEIKK